MAGEGSYYIGVDVGTGSARAALVSDTGAIVSVATHPIQIWEPEPDMYEQSSEDIWQACCTVVKMVTSNIDKDEVKGIGFDATCSLVVLDGENKPLSVSTSGDNRWNIIMWMDHRAEVQAQRINATHHKVLDYVGGTISLEMQMPKLLWIKENLQSECWDRAGHYFDLPDFLTWKATGSRSRSLCSLVCKWTYQADADGNMGWDKDFLRLIGLDDLILENFKKIGNEVKAPGEACGKGLSETAAQELGLNPKTPVGTSIIDAHAGGVGTLGCSAHSIEDAPLTSRLALICGTSTCHMAISERCIFVSGVWGPYFSAMVPGLWLNEGGQSATGKLIDHVVENHTAYSWIKEDAEKRKGKVHPHSVLNEILEFMAKKHQLESYTQLSKSMHVWPDYHGNRSPLADSSLKGMVCGLRLACGAEDLACQYLATIQALSYGTRHIIESLLSQGHDIRSLYMCGGLSKNPVFVQTHADITGLNVVLPDAKESVLLGSAMLGAQASNQFSSLQEAMSQMGGNGKVILPEGANKLYHDKKYKVFLKMVEHQKEYEKIME